MAGNERRNLEVSVDDFFDLIQIDAQAVDLETAKKVQADQARRAFVNNLIGYLEEFNRTNDNPRPAGYYEVFKQVLSSRTSELLALISAAKQKDVKFFTNMMKHADAEVLRRLGKLPVATPKPPSDVLVAEPHLRGQISAFHRLAMQATYVHPVYGTRRSSVE